MKIMNQHDLQTCPLAGQPCEQSELLTITELADMDVPGDSQVVQCKQGMQGPVRHCKLEARVMPLIPAHFLSGL